MRVGPVQEGVDPQVQGEEWALGEWPDGHARDRGDVGAGPGSAQDRRRDVVFLVAKEGVSNAVWTSNFV